MNRSNGTGPNQRNLPGPGPSAGNSGTASDDNGGISLPPWEQIVFTTVVLSGVVATIRRSGISERAYRAVWLRRQPRTDPRRDIERAFGRLEQLLERDHRPRRPGETRRQYVHAVGDDDDRRVAAIYEQAVYAGDPTHALAEEAIELVDEQISPPARIDTLWWRR